jgi:FMN phosphatase YigB (HAD superfamily)
MPLRAVAFDVYDTLASWPSGKVQPIDVQRLLGRFGIEISYQAYEAARQATFFFDCPKREITGWMDFLALLFARMEVPVSMDLIACVAAEYESRNDMVILPGAVEALESVRDAGLVTCAFTTLPRFMLGRRGYEITSRMDHYFDASSVGVAKGDRRFYERITQRLALAPDEIVAIGDDPLCDVQLPIEAGWRAILLLTEGHGPPAATSTITSLNQLLDAINRLATSGK